ncbi:threonine synthase [Mucilaginibacter terrae]|uniref:Threonine synthase n=1 Tax=Mucilaginibacter terrae TaxID=1955052 RepID=A0ABU3GVS7_9SPHI|nr:threonine synthase [Mucilaginibacter terrae]MDT3403877.1 threonine synthase [Mucilaginibacter terrae]
MLDLQVHSFIKGLVCPVCHEHYPAHVINTFCYKNECNTSLYAEYYLPQNLNPDEFLAGRPANMWRYHEFLPVESPDNVVTMGEGFTPILPLTNLEYITGDCEVLWKDESGNPTGSFKARGIGAAVSKAKELGITNMVTPTAGNAGGALAAYCARAGIKAHVYMPVKTPQVFKDECRLYGARLVEVDGNIADCGKLAHQEATANGWFQVSTLKEPYRLEGKKTMGYEIAEQLKWQVPDVILYPTGGGTGLLGIWKAFDEMEAMGWIGSKRPRMVTVQSESCNGITRAFHEGAASAEFIDGGFTVANGLRVPKPFADKLILKVLRQSNGTAITVSDANMEAALKEIAANEGMLIAPEGAALWHAFKKLKADGWIGSGEQVLLVNTGSGYKYLENLKIE